jgi:hypothetical protein
MPKADHETIYLEPNGREDPSIGRQWCQHDQWTNAEGYENDEPTKYIRADIALEMLAALRAILYQVTQGPIFERDACIIQARKTYSKAVNLT